jgi:hypothetical protein
MSACGYSRRLPGPDKLGVALTLTTAKWPRGATHHTGVPIDLWAHCVTLGMVFKCLGYHIPVELRTLIFKFAKPMPLPYVVSMGPARKIDTSFTWYGSKSALRGLNHTQPWNRFMYCHSTSPEVSYWRPVLSQRQYLKDMVGPDWRFTM